GIDLTGLAIILGFLSVGIGFGLQNITSNFVAGLILLLERPIKVGDRIMVGNQEGDVVEINMRSTTIRTLNNVAVIVPNSEFVSSKVENWSYGDETVRVDVNVGVSYESDLETVIRSLREVAAEHPQVLKNPAPDVLHTGFGDSAWNMRLRIWLEDSQRHLEVHSEINCAIVRKFQQNRVEIPFPQRDLHVRSPLPIPITPEAEFRRSA
ncbi:MAG TPA: mechanosensitive ion channel domain-containing protein, partial [Verrucomicrobiae bacterium]|nr:mechanosensitive ion channel domain-containing protein [Verrucomicrobiae bacterium]